MILRDLRLVLLGLILGFGCTFRPPSKALEYEATIGRSEFCCLRDGVYWQSPFGFNGSVRDLAFSIGARWRVGDFSIHSAYDNLGSANGLNVATMRDDDFGRFNATQPCDPAAQRNCLGYFAVKQSVAGVLLGAAYRVSLLGVTLEPEIGQFFYRSRMKVEIWCPNCGVAHRFAFGAGGTASYTSDLRRSPYVALRVPFGSWFLGYRWFKSIDGGGNANEGQFATCLTCGPVNEIFMGVTI